jgi:hypothetical protein
MKDLQTDATQHIAAIARWDKGWRLQRALQENGRRIEKAPALKAE